MTPDSASSVWATSVSLVADAKAPTIRSALLQETSLPSTHRRMPRSAIAAAATLTICACMGCGTACLAPRLEPTHDRIVSANPENFTPNVQDGRVNAMVQIGNRIIAVGKFTKVTVTGGATDHPQQHLRVQRHDRCDRQHLRPQRRHQGSLRHRRRRRRDRLHRRPVQLGQRRGQDAEGRADQRHHRRSRQRPSSPRTPTARSPTCSWPAASSTSVAPSRRSTSSLVRCSPRSTRRPAPTPTRLALTFADTWNGGTHRHQALRHQRRRHDAGRGRQLPHRQRPEPPADHDGRPLRTVRDAERLGHPALHDTSAPASSTPTCATSTSPPTASTSSWWRPARRPAASTPAPCATPPPAGRSARRLPARTRRWVQYSGGDTFTQVKVTGPAIYVGGHFRWMNNPYDSDSAGPGAVAARAGRPRPAQRSAVHLEPRPRPRRRRLGVPADDRRPLGRPRHQPHRRRGTQADRAVPARRRHRRSRPRTPAPCPATSTCSVSRPASTTVIDRAFNGTTVSSSATAGNGGQDWSSARGSFMINSTLYTGWADGTLKARTYNGTTFGAASNVNLNGLTSFASEIPNITGDDLRQGRPAGSTTRCRASRRCTTGTSRRRARSSARCASPRPAMRPASTGADRRPVPRRLHAVRRIEPDRQPRQGHLGAASTGTQSPGTRAPDVERSRSSDGQRLAGAKGDVRLRRLNR